MPWGIPTGNLLGRLPQTARPSVIALSFWLTSLLFSELLLLMFGTRAAPLYSFVLLLVMLGSAWLGYIPGVLICILTEVVAPRILLPSRPRHFDPVKLGLVLIVMLLISALAASKRRAASTLEQRVAQRTAELSQKQELLSEQAQLLNLATDAIFASDQNGVIRYWSRGAEELYGWTAVEAGGQVAQTLLKTVFPESLAATQRDLRSAGAWQGELHHTRKDGLHLIVMSRWAARRDGTGAPCGWLEINTDITARRRMEEQLRQAQRMEAVGRLAGGISHDFNNLLTVINGYADMILEGQAIDSVLRDNLQQISAAGHRAAELTRGLLTFSRKQIVRPGVVSLNAVIVDVEKMLRRLLGEDVELNSVLAPDLWDVHADRSHLEQVIMNLAVNARDAMPSGGTLTIETINTTLDDSYCGSHLRVEPGEYVLLAVTDTGIGMDQETQVHIFEPFFTTKEVGKGTGLGLATVYGIVQQSGGTISVYSEIGHGTTFKAYLRRAVATTALPTPEVAESDARGPRHGESTVLLVEDDESLGKLTATILKRHGYRVITAQSAAEALELCISENGAIDVVLSDLIMPQMSGQQLAEEIRERYPVMKLVFMSGYTEHTIVSRIALDPAVQFVTKPFTSVTLMAALNKALGRVEMECEGRAGGESMDQEMKLHQHETNGF